MNGARAHVEGEAGQDKTPPIRCGETIRISRDCANVLHILSFPNIVLTIRTVHPREFLFLVLRVDGLILCPSPRASTKQSTQPAPGLTRGLSRRWRRDAMVVRRGSSTAHQWRSLGLFIARRFYPLVNGRATLGGITKYLRRTHGPSLLVALPWSQGKLRAASQLWKV